MNFDIKDINKYNKVLVLAVGGGNDSVSTLLLQQELNKSFGYQPDYIDIVAVLPDCLEYHNLTNTSIELISVINPNSERSVGDKKINAFPEKVLSQYKAVIPELNIQNVYGISMDKGSTGISFALKELVSHNNYDLVLAIDVGGDFIACEDNIEVLSPMMDGYMLYALKELKFFLKNRDIKTEILFSIFGLATDGESTSDMLDKAMSFIPDIQEFEFNKDNINGFVSFYRNIVEHNRYSRTTDYTIKEILGENHDNPSPFRGRFHVKTKKNEKAKIYYGDFYHKQDEKFYGKYYIFQNIDNIKNVYSKPAKNGLYWFLNTQKQDTKINHELNGQSYNNLEQIFNNHFLYGKSLFFGTPSRKFTKEQQNLIIKDIQEAILNEVYDFAIIYKEYEDFLEKNIKYTIINEDLILISLSEEKNNILINSI